MGQPDGISAATRRLYPDRPLRIGLIELSDASKVTGLVAKSVRALREAFHPYQIDIEEFSSAELEKAILDRTVDAFIASSGFYWRRVPIGARDVATMISRRSPDPNQTSAITFITSSENRTIHTLEDMRGARLSASYPTAFMGYRIGLAEIASRGYDPETFFSSVVFSSTPEIEPIAGKVLDGRADVAFVQTCWLESLSPAGRARFRVIAPIEDGITACVRSTAAYPNITVTVLREWSVKRWIDAHKPWIAAFIFCLALLVGHSFIVSLLVRRRTDELARANAEKAAVEHRLQALYERMEKFRKANTVSQLSSMIAHELAQPIGAAVSYCNGLKLLVQKKTLTEEKLASCINGLERGLMRSRSIIEKVRSYNRGGVDRDQRLSLPGILATARDSMPQPLVQALDIAMDAAPDIFVLGDQLELELLFNNLLSNAVSAALQTDERLVAVRAAACGGKVVVTVENSGRMISEADLTQLATPFISERGNGHGLGIPISMSLAEANGGHLHYVPRPAGGLIAEVSLRQG